MPTLVRNKAVELDPAVDAVTGDLPGSRAGLPPRIGGFAAWSRSPFFLLALLAVQFGSQPYIFKHFTPRIVAKSSLVLGTDVAKITASFGILVGEGRFRLTVRGWTVKDFLFAAGAPSVTFLLQTYCIQIAYSNLDSVVFNVLNQTKLMFTALFVYLVAGRGQSRVQCFALLMLTVAGVCISSGGESGSSEISASERRIGIIAICIASALSGLGAGVTEYIMCNKKRDNYLLTAEMSSLGCCINIGALLLNVSPDSRFASHHGLFAGWTVGTVIPILTQALGGILVGLVTKVTGAVMKSFAIIFGLILTCVLRCMVGGEPLPMQAYIGVPLAMASLYLHSTYPLAAQHKAVKAVEPGAGYGKNGKLEV